MSACLGKAGISAVAVVEPFQLEDKQLAIIDFVELVEVTFIVKRIETEEQLVVGPDYNFALALTAAIIEEFLKEFED